MGTVRIRHPVTGGKAVVPQASLGTWVRAGWTEDDTPPPVRTPPAKAAPPGLPASAQDASNDPPGEAAGTEGKDDA